MRRLVVGVGLSSAATPAELAALVDHVLAVAGADRRDVARLATLAARADAPPVTALARALGVPVDGHAAADLAAVAVPNPSETVRARTGTPSVAEAAALRSAHTLGRAVLLVGRTAAARATAALAGPPRPEPSTN
ncbi:cobalamin biosynthesis protein [Actinomadura atramentaria]|uniref:cobalamin biosynthesis protein n=1 Tax=Actinomadura atramentaria TaxID=1990 RepID=UPI00036F6D78|nr:cobalamin biosynthesis protein [Actinomadura atramentaria]